jgi:hypothetical protein
VVKFVLIYSHTKLSGKLTKLFTGSFAYHCGFLDEATDTFYDMHWIPRKISWSERGYKDYTLHHCPLTAKDCEKYMKQDSLKIRYGWMDYILFALRPLYHLIGKSTRNADGWICSEMCNVWWWRKRHEGTPFDLDDAPPSPADFERWLHAG